MNDELPLFRHTDGSEAIQDGERLLPREARDGLGFGVFLGGLSLDEVINSLPQKRSRSEAFFIEVAELAERGDFARGRDTVERLKLLGELVGNDRARLFNKGGEAVARGGVE